MIVYTYIFDALGEIIRIKRDPKIDDRVVDHVASKIDVYVEHRKCFVIGQYNLQYSVIDGVCYLCCSINLQYRICFMYIQRLAELVSRLRIQHGYASTPSTPLLPESRHNLDYANSEINKLMILYSNAENVDKIESIKRDIDEVIEIMHNNINKILERGESLESLALRASDLTIETSQFKRGAKQVRCKLCLQNIKMILLLTAVSLCVVLCIILLVVSGLCYFKIGIC